MAIRHVGGEAGQPMYVTMSTIASFAAQPATCKVGAIVIPTTAGNWAINSAAADTKILSCGQIVHVEDDLKVATVKMFGYDKCHRCAYSGSPTLGWFVIMSDTACKVAGSSNATMAASDAIVVSIDTDATELYWFEK